MTETYLIAQMAATIFAANHRLEDYTRHAAVDDAIEIYNYTKGRLSAMNTAAWDRTRKHERL